MLALLFFFGTALLLAFEGRCLLIWLAGSKLTRIESWALGFPIAALINALLVFIFMIVSIPFTPLTIMGGHVSIAGGLFCINRSLRSGAQIDESALHWSSLAQWQKVIVLILTASIVVKIGYGLLHSVILPTYYYDSLSQWSMRAQISYVDQAVAFDADEIRGLSKPNYPILVHALQITFMQLQGSWNDAVANGATFLLSLSSFTALFFLLLRKIGLMFSVLTLWGLLSLPLVSMHLSQGYGDIHVIQYLLLSAVLLGSFVESKNLSVLLLSALLVSAAAWTKQEGLFFGVVPWAFLLCVWTWHQKQNWKRSVKFGIAPAIILGGMWSALLVTKGMSLSPHGDGLNIAFHAEAIEKAKTALLAAGSFGIHWYVLAILLTIVLSFTWKVWKKYLHEYVVLMWGLITLVQAIYVFFFTPNVSYLLNSQTFSRTMMIPFALLLLAISFLLQKIDSRVQSRE